MKIRFLNKARPEKRKPEPQKIISRNSFKNSNCKARVWQLPTAAVLPFLDYPGVNVYLSFSLFALKQERYARLQLDGFVFFGRRADFVIGGYTWT
jgi:hypothetical protein